MYAIDPNTRRLETSGGWEWRKAIKNNGSHGRAEISNRSAKAFDILRTDSVGVDVTSVVESLVEDARKSGRARAPARTVDVVFEPGFERKLFGTVPGSKPKEKKVNDVKHQQHPKKGAVVDAATGTTDDFNEDTDMDTCHESELPDIHEHKRSTGNSGYTPGVGCLTIEYSMCGVASVFIVRTDIVSPVTVSFGAIPNALYPAKAQGYLTSIVQAAHLAHSCLRGVCIRYTNIAIWGGGNTIHARRLKLADTESLLQLIMQMVLSHTAHMCYVVILLGLWADPDYLKVCAGVVLLCYGMCQYPRPKKAFWRLCTYYYCLLIVVKTAFQLPSFCEMGQGSGFSLWPDPRCIFANAASSTHGSSGEVHHDSLSGHASKSHATATLGLVRSTNLDLRLSGVYKTDMLLWACTWEILAVLSLLLHRHMMLHRGLWDLNELQRFKNNESSQPKPAGSLRHGKDASSGGHQEDNERKQQKQRNQSLPGLVTRATNCVAKLFADTAFCNGNDTGSTDAVNCNVDVDGKARTECKITSGASGVSPLKVAPNNSSAMLGLMSKPGIDLYAPGFVIELICAILIVVAYSDLVGTTGVHKTIGDSLNTNRFSGGMVLTLFAQLLFIICDRVAYLFGSIGYRGWWGKVALQVAMVWYWSSLIVVTWPRMAHRPVHDNPLLMLFFALKLGYLAMSALQIQRGYVRHARMSQFHKTPGIYQGMLFKAYRAIPFVFEMQSLLDWACNTTSLDVWESFTLDDIYANMYTVQCDIIYRKQRKRGEPQPRIRKATSGSGVFIMLVLVLFGPIYLFSSANPAQVSNNVLEASLQASIIGPQGSYRLFEIPSVASLRPVNDDEYNFINSQQVLQPDDKRSSVQFVRLNSFSDKLFSMSPPALAQLVKTLNETDMYPIVKLQINLQFTRPGPLDLKVIQGYKSRILPNNTRTRLARLLLDEDRNGVKENPHNVAVFPDLMPVFMRLPATGDINTIDSGFLTTLDASLTQTNGDISNRNIGRYWYLCSHDWSSFGMPQNMGKDIKSEQRKTNRSKVNGNGDDNCPGLSLFTVSNPIFPELGGGSYSIIGLYLTVVLTIGRFARMAFSGQLSRVIYEQLHEVDDLVQYCEVVYIARLSGQYELEEELYRKLVKIFRTPDLLITMTRRKDDKSVEYHHKLE